MTNIQSIKQFRATRHHESVEELIQNNWLRNREMDADRRELEDERNGWF